MSVFKLPDVGEGLVEADIAAWKVAAGDVVAVNDILVEIETAKSLVELPSPFAGPVAELLVDEGDTVAVGTPIIRFESADAPAAEPSTDPAAEAPTSDTAQAPAGDQASAAAEDSSDSGGKVLVGYGISATPAGTSVRLGTGRPRDSSHAPAPAEAAASSEAAAPSETAAPAAPAGSASPTPGQRPRATPPVRAFAKKNGIALADVTGTGPQGRILREDVNAAIASAASTATDASSSSTGQGDSAQVREERTPLKGVRKAISQAMVRSYTEIPHAEVSTEFDITPTMDFIAEIKGRREFGDRKITPLLFVAKAVIRAVKRNPRINTLLDGEEIVQRHYVNLGIAAATPRGLIVPNIKDAHTMTFTQLEDAITGLVGTARDGKTTPADQTGGTITITNAGIFGVDTGKPIINPGEPAIVGMGAIREKPWVVDGEVVPRMVTNIGVTVDHRIIDGDVAGWFLSDVIDALSDPRMAGIE